MAPTWSNDHSYASARALRAPYVQLEVVPRVHQPWVESQGGSQGKSEAWYIPTPSNNAATAQLLYGITSRGMRWRARKTRA